MQRSLRRAAWVQNGAAGPGDCPPVTHVKDLGAGQPLPLTWGGDGMPTSRSGSTASGSHGRHDASWAGAVTYSLPLRPLEQL